MLIYMVLRCILLLILLFMKEKLENIYNKKSRLKSKIQRSNAADVKDFLEYIT